MTIPIGSLIYTKKGLIPVEELQHTILKVISCGEQRTVRITTENGSWISCPNQEIGVVRSSLDDIEWKTTDSLSISDWVFTFNSLIEGLNDDHLHIDTAWVMGILPTDLCIIKNNRLQLVFPVDKKEYAEKAQRGLQYITQNQVVVEQSIDKRHYFVHVEWDQNFDANYYLHNVPKSILTSTLKNRFAYILGVYDSCEEENYICSSSKKEWVEKLQQLCTSCGLDTQLCSIENKLYINASSANTISILMSRTLNNKKNNKERIISIQEAGSRQCFMIYTKEPTGFYCNGYLFRSSLHLP